MFIGIHHPHAGGRNDASFRGPRCELSRQTPGIGAPRRSAVSGSPTTHALLVAHLQALARSWPRGNAHRHSGPVREPAGACAGAQLRRDELGSGAKPHRAECANEARLSTSTHDCERHGTTTLFAGPVDGTIISMCQPAPARGVVSVPAAHHKTPKQLTRHIRGGWSSSRGSGGCASSGQPEGSAQHWQDPGILILKGEHHADTTASSNTDAPDRQRPGGDH